MARISVAIAIASLLVGCTSDPSSLTGTSSSEPFGALAFSDAYADHGQIFVRGQDGSADALTRGFLPAVSPDGSMIAFLRDPSDPRAQPGDDPFVLQLWLIGPGDRQHPRMLAQQRRCCIGLSPDLHWSRDGSQIVLTALRDQRIDVVTAGSPIPSPT